MLARIANHNKPGVYWTASGTRAKKGENVPLCVARLADHNEKGLTSMERKRTKKKQIVRRKRSYKKKKTKKKTKKDFTVSWNDIAGILIDHVPKTLVENGLNATSKEVANAFSSMRCVCRGWREVVDQSIPWTAAKYFYISWSTERKPFLIKTLEYRQMTLFHYAMEHL